MTCRRLPRLSPASGPPCVHSSFADSSGSRGDTTDQQATAGAEAEAQTSHPAWLQRSHVLLGDDRLGQLEKTNVLLVGLGGVGSFAAEFLCR